MQNNQQTRAFFCRNTPVLLTAVTGCLLACNQFTPGNEPPEIRRQGTYFTKNAVIVVALSCPFFLLAHLFMLPPE